jgi:hypothetical protein
MVRSDLFQREEVDVNENILLRNTQARYGVDVSLLSASRDLNMQNLRFHLTEDFGPEEEDSSSEELSPDTAE